MTYKYKQHILNLLENYKKVFPNENFELLEKQLENDENLWTRKNFNGHLTASAYILSGDFKKIVLIHNINLDKWLAPGGHWEESDGEMVNNAFREASEETGLSDLELFSWHRQNNMIPIDIDTHYIPENKKKEEGQHFHHDFRYIFVYNGNLEDTKMQELEVKGLKWIDLNDELENFSSKKVIEKIKNII